MRHTRRTRLVGAGAAMAAVLSAAQATSASSAQPADSPGYLFDVSVVSSTNSWAVGTEDGGAKTTIWHWDGKIWTHLDSPNPGTEVNELFGVEAISANDVWAVGRYGDISGGSVYTLIMHYDGNDWSAVDGPVIGGPQDALLSVGASGPNDVWAVGHGDVGKTIVEHWNGKRWKAVSYAATSDLRGVVAFAADDAWAVGQEGSLGHWDGSSWAVSGGGPSYTQDISGSSSSDLWAVGGALHAPQASHWDGAEWSVAHMPHGRGYNFTLNGVGAISPTDVWAVGFKHRPVHHGNEAVPLLEHWTGGSWSTARHPKGLDKVVLNGVDGSSGSDVWAVGGLSGLPLGYRAAILHWDGKEWRRVV